MNDKRYSMRSELGTATAVSGATLQAAVTAYKNARMDGLCHEGAWESALDVLRSLNMAQLAAELEEELNHA